MDVVVVVGGANETPVRDAIHTTATIAPLTPIIFCTAYDQANARIRAGLPTTSTLWLDAGPIHLQRAIADVLRLLPRLQLADAIQQAGILKGTMAAVTGTLRASRPPRTRSAMARLQHCSISSLDRRWRREVHAHVQPPMTIHRFLQWAWIARAWEIRTASDSWSEVAYKIRLCVRTLRTAGRETLALKLQSISELNERAMSNALMHRFRAIALPAPQTLDGQH